MAGIGSYGTQPIDLAAAGAKAEDASVLRARVSKSKSLAQGAWDAAEALRQQAVRAAEQRKTEETAINTSVRELDGHLRTANAALRGFFTKTPLAPRATSAEDALKLAAREYDAAKRLAAPLVTRSAALSVIDDRNTKISEQAAQKASDAKSAAAQADGAAKVLDKLARIDKSLAESAWQARAEVAIAKAAANGASSVAALAARALQVGRADSPAVRRAKAEKDLNALRGKLAIASTAAADTAALIKVGLPKGACDLRRVDFKNHSFPGFQLRSGETLLSLDDLTVRLSHRETIYGDLDGDGSPEAFVSIESGDALQSPNDFAGSANEFYAFAADASCRVKSLDKIDGVQGKIVGNTFVVDRRGRHSEWRLVNGRLTETSIAAR